MFTAGLKCNLHNNNNKKKTTPCLSILDWRKKIWFVSFFLFLILFIKKLFSYSLFWSYSPLHKLLPDHPHILTHTSNFMFFLLLEDEQTKKKEKAQGAHMHTHNNI